MPSHLKIRARLLRTTAIAALIVVAMLGSPALPGAGGVQTGPGQSSTRLQALAVTASDWTTYHHDSLGSGVDPSGNSYSPATPAWNSPTLDGQIYGQPLVFAGMVFAATENDTIYALAANTGAVLWSTKVGTAVPSGDLPCGNITPTVGVTGTPVIDSARQEIFAVADEIVSGSITHHLVGLNVYTGALDLNQPVDPPGSTPAVELQRTGLNLDGGRVVFGFGGNEAAIAPLTTTAGWFLRPRRAARLPTTTPHRTGLWAASGWGAAPRSMPRATSGPEPATALPQGPTTAATRWSSSPQPWQRNSSSPHLTGSHRTRGPRPGILSARVHREREDLSGWQVAHGVSAQPGGPGRRRGPDLERPGVYQRRRRRWPRRRRDRRLHPCAGPESRRSQTSPSISVLWQAPDGIGTPPIFAGGLIWSIANGNLYALNPANGTEVQHFAIGPSVSSFPSPSAADGLILAPSSTQVHAFEGPAGLPSLPTTGVLIPSGGATLSGTAILDASASNATSVEFRLFGGTYGYAAPVLCTATPSFDGWLCSWKTSTVPNGSYVLVSEAFNASGSAFSSGVRVTVKNPPTTGVLIPSGGATLSGTATLDASASNATSVEFRLFGGPYGYAAPVLCTATPSFYGWLCSWKTSTVPNGSYVLVSEAFNASGSAFSSGVSITVKNPPTTGVLIPSSGATASGSTYLDASASNATSVEFRLFGGTYGFAGPVVCTATPTLYGWLCAWNTSTVPNGSYVLASEALSALGAHSARA